MNITLVRHLWGVDLTHGLAQYAPHWREVGYEAVEVSLRHVPDRTQFLRFLKEASFRWVPQVFSHDFQPGGSVREHLDSLREQMEECLAHEPMFFNAHSGADTWSAAEAEDFYAQAIELEKEIGVPVSHETHRQRYFATPWQTRHILQQFPDLRITMRLEPLGLRVRAPVARLGRDHRAGRATLPPHPRPRRLRGGAASARSIRPRIRHASRRA